MINKYKQTHLRKLRLTELLEMGCQVNWSFKAFPPQLCQQKSRHTSTYLKLKKQVPFPLTPVTASWVSKRHAKGSPKSQGEKQTALVEGQDQLASHRQLAQGGGINGFLRWLSRKATYSLRAWRSPQTNDVQGSRNTEHLPWLEQSIQPAFKASWRREKLQ